MDTMRVNDHARPGEAKIAALAIMYPSTSNNPSQGSDLFDVYAFGYWQYIDILVMWGGAAGEGLILSPSPDVIDAAHRNGVPVYGTIFFPPLVYGGQIQWVHDLVQKEGDVFPVADKLIEVAEYYGFDGWFINQETAGGDSALAGRMRDFMEYIQEHSDVRLMWYDAMTEGGAIEWQNELNGANDAFFHDGGVISEEMFLNFWWSGYGLYTSAYHAQGLGRSPYDLFAGIDVQANGYNTWADFDAVFPESEPHRVSLGFYCPNWCYSNSSGHQDYYQRASRFWVGANRDPSNTASSSQWKGMAHYIPARSVIGKIPFATAFNTGQGHFYAIDGQLLRIGDWNNRSLQDVLPTWRWLVTGSGAPLYPELDWSDAYQGGSCLKISGDLNPASPTHLKLFKTRLDVTGDTELLLTYKTGSAETPSNLQVGIAFTGQPDVFEFFDAGTSSTIGWNQAVVPLSAHSGKTIAVISLQVQSDMAENDYTVRIGQLAVLDGSAGPPSPPSGLTVDQFRLIDSFRGTLRLNWNHSPDPVYAYYVYHLHADSSRTFLGGTPNNAYFVSQIDRLGDEQRAVIQVEAVGQDFSRSVADTVSIAWDEPVGVPQERDDEGSVLPGDFGLHQNYPNPFNPGTRIRYQIPTACHLTIRIFNVRGQQVATLMDDRLQRGGYTAWWDGCDERGEKLSTGVYFCSLRAGSFEKTIKLLLIR
jgi:mannosyl-glycoprotein endo-beta-N-acetylglucosaminidase